MATVYLAHDVGQGQPVAIKIMHRDLSAALDAERFRREMGIAASLSHPSIVPLYESGNIGGVLYYCMPYIEGGSLYQRPRGSGNSPWMRPSGSRKTWPTRSGTPTCTASCTAT